MGEGIRGKGPASDYWEDKDPAFPGLTAPSTSGVPHPSLQAHHPIPSTQENFLLHLLPIVHLSLHSSPFSPTKGSNNTTTQQPAARCPSFIQIPAPRASFLIRPLQSVPVVERDTPESFEEYNWQILVWSRHPVRQQIPYSNQPMVKAPACKQYLVSQTKTVILD